MPIKKIIMDWGDQPVEQVQSNAKNGLYKNRKPFCGASQSQCYNANKSGKPKTGITCTKDSQCQQMNDDWYCNDGQVSPGEGSDLNGTSTIPKSFGNAERACQKGFFEYKHTYSCSPSDIIKYGQTVKEATKVPTNLRNNPFINSNDNNDYYDGLRERLLDKGLDLNNDEVCVYR
ncbi:MAG: hypothetical protein ABEJ24_00020, partial [Candidatus Magasanikbacteria bacterium]